MDSGFEMPDVDLVADGAFNLIAGAEAFILDAGACLLSSVRVIRGQHAPYIALVGDRLGRFNWGTFSIGGKVVGLGVSRAVSAIVALNNITVGDAEQGEAENERELHFCDALDTVLSAL